MAATEVVYDPSKSGSAVPDGGGFVLARDMILARYGGELHDYCEAKREATVCQISYWEAEDNLASVLVIVEARAIDILTTEGKPKLTEYMLKARVKEILELHDDVRLKRNAFEEARKDRALADSALSQARERLTMTKHEIALHTGARD